MSCLQPAKEIVLSLAALILPLGFSKAHGESAYPIMNLARGVRKLPMAPFLVLVFSRRANLWTVWPDSVNVETQEQVREAVDALHKDGVNLIKVYSRLPRVAYFAVAAEAQKDGLTYVGHVPIYVSARRASVEH